MYTIGGMSSTDASEQRVQKDLLSTWNAIGQEILANFVAK